MCLANFKVCVDSVFVSYYSLFGDYLILVRVRVYVNVFKCSKCYRWRATHGPFAVHSQATANNALARNMRGGLRSMQRFDLMFNGQNYLKRIHTDRGHDHIQTQNTNSNKHKICCIIFSHNSLQFFFSFPQS